MRFIFLVGHSDSYSVRQLWGITLITVNSRAHASGSDYFGVPPYQLYVYKIMDIKFDMAYTFIV